MFDDKLMKRLYEKKVYFPKPVIMLNHKWLNKCHVMHLFLLLQ